jgi:hypothetical protein
MAAHISEIENELRALALKLAKERGLKISEDDLIVTLRIKGHSRHHQGWSAQISAEQWKAVFKIEWPENVRKAFETLRERENQPLTYAELEALEINFGYPPFEEINAKFRRAHLPLHFSAVEKLSRRRREREGRYQLFIKPTA